MPRSYIIHTFPVFFFFRMIKFLICAWIKRVGNNVIFFLLQAVCIDMEGSVVARFRTGQFRHLFDDTCLLTNYPGSGNNW